MYFIQDSQEAYNSFKKEVMSEIFSKSIDYDADSILFIKKFLNSDFFESMKRSDGSRYWLMAPSYTVGSFFDENKIPAGNKFRKDQLYWLGGEYFDDLLNNKEFIEPSKKLENYNLYN